MSCDDGTGTAKLSCYRCGVGELSTMDTSTVPACLRSKQILLDSYTQDHKELIGE